MKEGLNEVKVFYDYSIKEDNDKETKILETIKYSDMANAYMREIQAKKDDAFLTTWFNGLNEKDLLHIHTLLETIMKERNVIK